MEKFTFTKSQTVIIDTSINRLRKQKGIILKAPMGYGKTKVAIAIGMNIKDIHKIIVICPDSVKRQWEDDATSLGEHEIKTVAFDDIVYFVNTVISAKSNETPVYIFDECHQLRTLINEMTVSESELVCKFFNRSYKCIGLTGTLIFKNVDDLLYEINIMSGLKEERWRVPFSWNHLVDVYPNKSYTKAFAQGWVATIWNLGIGAMTIAKLADIADFYLTQNLLYKTNKIRLVQSILRSIPGLDKDVLTTTEITDIKLAKVMTIPTIILAYGMMSPFSSLIPTLFGIIAVEHQNDLKKLNTTKFCDHVKNLFVIAPDELSTSKPKPIQRHIECALRASATSLSFGLLDNRLDTCPTETTVKLYKFNNNNENERTTITLTIESHVSKVSYTPQQLQAFIRFTTNRLTVTEANKLGISRLMHTRKTILTMEDLITTGLRIGNMIITPVDVKRINKENNERISMFWNSAESQLPPFKIASSDPQTTRALLLNVDRLRMSVSELPPNPEPKVQNSTIPKFDKMLKIIRDNMRTVVYSQFVDDIIKFQEYAVSNRLDTYLALGEQAFNSKRPLGERVDDAKRKFNEHNERCVLLLDSVLSEGIRGILNVDALIIMEPAQSSAMKQQIIARAARAHSYERSCKLKVYEFVCVAPKARRMLAAAKDWWQHDASVGYWVFKPVFDQLRTPDQIVKQQQNNMDEVESTIVKCANPEKKKHIKH